MFAIFSSPDPYSFDFERKSMLMETAPPRHPHAQNPNRRLRMPLLHLALPPNEHLHLHHGPRSSDFVVPIFFFVVVGNILMNKFDIIYWQIINKTVSVF